jgi:small subunit ribosomal protein S17
MTTNEQAKGRTLTGIVTSDKRSKTVTVEVSHLKMHPKYRKQYKVSEKYHAHDEKGEYHTGDKVVIRETRPLSKTKRWTVIQKLIANS